MSDNNEIDPHIEAVLRDVPAADPSLREQHIAAALGQLSSPARATGQRRFASVAAAVLLLAIGGVALARGNNDTTPAIAADSSSTTIAKSLVDCGEEWSGLWGDSVAHGDFSWAEADYAVIGHNGALSVYLAQEPCTKVGDIDYWAAMDARDKETDTPGNMTECSYVTEPIARFTDRANDNPYSLVLVQTDVGVSLHFEDRCNEPLGSITLPTSGD
jgi:hypothetical protein